MLFRMVEAVGNVAQPASQGGSGSDTGAVRALIDVIKKEEVTINVDLDSKIKVYVLLRRAAVLRACLCMHVGDFAGYFA